MGQVPLAALGLPEEKHDLEKARRASLRRLNKKAALAMCQLQLVERRRPYE